MLVYKQIPKNRYDPIFHYSKQNFSGLSYLLHPDVLLYNSYLHTTKDIAIYAGIASLRSYADYLVNKTCTLPGRLCPIKLEEHLEDGNLITLDKEGNLHFLYEDPNPSLIH